MGAVAIIKHDDTRKMFVSPIFKKSNDVLDYTLMNSSNIKFAPVMVDTVIVDHFLMIHSHHQMPNFALKGIKLALDQPA